MQPGENIRFGDVAFELFVGTGEFDVDQEEETDGNHAVTAEPADFPKRLSVAEQLALAFFKAGKSIAAQPIETDVVLRSANQLVAGDFPLGPKTTSSGCWHHGGAVDQRATVSTHFPEHELRATSESAKRGTVELVWGRYGLLASDPGAAFVSVSATSQFFKRRQRAN